MNRSEFTIIYPPNVPFFRMHQRPQQMCIAMAELGYRVVFCDSMQLQAGKTVPFKKYDSGGELWITFDLMNYISGRNLTKDKNIYYFSYGRNAHNAPIVNPMFSVWDYLDDFAQNRPYDTTAHQFANAILATARVLEEKALKDRRGENVPVTLCENACSAEIFDWMSDFHDGGALDLPPLSEIKRKLKIYYVGAISGWMVWDNLLDFAEELEDEVEIHLIGDRFLFGSEFDGVSLDVILNEHPNVFELGHRKYEDLPEYFNDADAFILPFITPAMTSNKDMQDLMRATNPIKIWEYLASGKPIISTELPEVAHICNKYPGKTSGLRFANTARDMVIAAKSIKMTGSRFYPTHVDIARENTWAQRASQLDAVIQDLVDRGVDHRTAPEPVQLV